VRREDIKRVTQQIGEWLSVRRAAEATNEV